MCGIGSKSKSFVSAIAIVSALGMATAWEAPFHGFVGAAYADTHDGESGGKGGQDGQGKQAGQSDEGGHSGAEGEGKGGPGAQAGQENQNDKGQGQGGPGPDSEGQGPQAGAPSSTGGGKPVWAQEGIPEIELGRLNVARSPSHVLDRAYDEALATISPDMVSFYNLSLDQVISSLSLNWDNVTFIDSPLQNLALLKDALDGSSGLSNLGVTNNVATLEAIFLGSASDKSVPITKDTVTAVTTILGSPVTGAAADQLAAQAEAVRIAILAGHG
ncbi:hypothetical protein [Thioclava atlantica]|uniref:Uncharacterized protein n=1 Tax=Thioclava atlantica TaxID=1317124 RepID=A0A085TXJ3_9RHOB|nr:hypothetical protein [Thioclava atlantica]KFE35440.1 hypothetical protein DW2_08422 [Thioclava atlantica]